MATTEAIFKDLFMQGLAGSDKAYQIFLQKMSEALRGYFRKRMQQQLSEVEDLVQEVLIALHTQRHTFDAAYPVTAWVYGIARYKLMDFYRRRHQSLVSEHIDIDEVAELLGTEESGANDASHDIALLLEQLPVKQREAITLVKLEGLSIAEASAKCGQSSALIKVNIHRGLKQLTARLQHLIS